MKMPIVLHPIFFQWLVFVMFVAAGSALISADDATAQLRIEITEGQVAPTPIAIAEFTGPDGDVTEVGRQLTQIISDDLESSGLFRPVDSAALPIGHRLGSRDCWLVLPILMMLACYRWNLCCGMW